MRNKSRKLITTIAVFVLMIFISFWIWRPSGAEAAWFDDNFAYRNAIPISSHTAAENNVYISATIDTSTSGQFQADCGDLRFTDYAGNQLPYYISSGCASASTVVHVFFDTMPAGAQTLYYYYGNPSATNGFNTADFATQASSYAVGSIGSQEKGGAPVAYWKFDEGTGTTTTDSSSNKFIGTLTNGPTWQTEDMCTNSNCLYFDGSNDYVDTGDRTVTNFGTGDFSVSAWIKTRSTETVIAVGRYQSGGASDFWLGLSSGITTFSITGVTVSESTASTNDGKWHYITATRQSGVAYLYVDGKLRNSATNTQATNTGGNILIGSFNASYIWPGFIDDVKIYNYARTAAQVKADYTARGQQKGVAARLGSSSKNLDALSNGLVGYWKMDEASGNALDASGNSNTGVATGTTVVTGKFGNGRSTPASNYLTVTSATSLNFTSTTTHAIWIYPTSWPGAGVGRIFGRTDYSLDIAVDSAGSGVCGQGKIAIYTPSSSWKCTNYQLSLNTWYHAVFVFDGSYWKLYINGELAWTNSSTSTINISTNLYLGTTPADYAQNFLGTMDEVRIYNRALSPKEIRDLYNWAPGPVGYWNFEEQNGGDANDISGNSNTGTNTGTTAVTGKYGKSRNFDGATNKIAVASTITGSQTVEAWIYPTSTTSNILQLTASAYISASSGTLSATGFTSPTIYVNGIVSSTITANQWQHIAVSTGTAISANAINFGLANSVYYSGKLDEIKIYNYARTQKQIVEDMNGGHPAGGSPVGSQVGYWKFDEGYGTVANNSGNSGSALNGTITGATWNNNGKFGKALNFDGVNDSISKSSPSGLPTGSSARTISLWMNPTNTNPGGVLVHYGDGPTTGQEFILAMQTISGSTYLFTDGDNGSNNLTVSGSEIPASGQWSHLVFTVDSSSNWKYYLNGKYTKGGTFAVAISTVTPTSLDIGVREGSTGYFPGMLDEVKIYNYALTQDEIALDYNHGLALALGNTGSASNSAAIAYCVPGSTDTCTPPVAEWNFEEGSGSSAQDLSGSGNTGTITGATYVPGKLGKALNFNGGTDTVTISNSISTKSIELWIYPSTTTQNLIDLRTAATAANISVSSGTISATGFTSPTIYVNGVVSSTLVANTWQYVTITTGTTITANAIQLGRISSTSLTGKLDSVRIFDYTRTAAQVAWDYNRGLPITHFKMDECQGNTLNDSSGNSNNPTISIGASGTQTAVGTCTSSGAWYNGATGKFNSSLNFDGTDDYASKTSPTNLPSGSSSFTTSLWLKSSSGTSNLYVLKWGTPSTKTMNAIIYYGGTSSVSHAFYAADLSSGTNSITSGAWNHVLVTWDGTTRRIYINGKEKTSDTPTSINVTANQTLYVASYAGGSNFFPGQLDDIRIYNYALTATQAKQVYNEGAGVRFGP